MNLEYRIFTSLNFDLKFRINLDKNACSLLQAI